MKRVLKCQVFVADRHYAKPGYCQRPDAKIVRWAPTPLKTKVLRLCANHRAQLERGTLALGGTK